MSKVAFFVPKWSQFSGRKMYPFHHFSHFKSGEKGKHPHLTRGNRVLLLFIKRVLLLFSRAFGHSFSAGSAQKVIYSIIYQLNLGIDQKSLKRNWLSIPPSLLSPSEVTVAFFSVWNAAEMGANSTENGDRFEKCRFVISTRSASHYSHTAFEKWAS